jgi:hypothetical protein
MTNQAKQKDTAEFKNNAGKRDLPKRNFLNKQELEACFSNEDTLIIDATEQRTVRPTDLIDQKECLKH